MTASWIQRRVPDQESPYGLQGIEPPPAYVAGALCSQTDPEVFFPVKGGSSSQAKRICLACDVREDCARWALETDQRFGIWGALSPRERRKIQRAAA